MPEIKDEDKLPVGAPIELGTWWSFRGQPPVKLGAMAPAGDEAWVMIDGAGKEVDRIGFSVFRAEAEQGLWVQVPDPATVPPPASVAAVFSLTADGNLVCPDPEVQHDVGVVVARFMPGYDPRLLLAVVDALNAAKIDRALIRGA